MPRSCRRGRGVEEDRLPHQWARRVDDEVGSRRGASTHDDRLAGALIRAAVAVSDSKFRDVGARVPNTDALRSPPVTGLERSGAKVAQTSSFLSHRSPSLSWMRKLSRQA